MLASDSAPLGNSVCRIVSLSSFISILFSYGTAELSERASDAGIPACLHSRGITLESLHLGCLTIPAAVAPNSVWVTVPVRLVEGDH
jgi:hypothetical protein